MFRAEKKFLTSTYHFSSNDNFFGTLKASFIFFAFLQESLRLLFMGPVQLNAIFLFAFEMVFSPGLY
jgi:hypothetical protein